MKYKEDLKEKKYNYNLSLLKVLACIAVVGLHTFRPNAMILYYLCGFAVPIFFMTSGYLIFGKEKITWNYSLIKIIKIIRLIFLWNLLIYFIGLITRFLIGLDLSYYGIEALIKEMIGSLVQRGEMWQFWYLGALILIYFMLPVVQKIMKNVTNEKTGLICIWCIFVVISVSIQVLSMYLGQPIQIYVFQNFRIWSWLQYFIAGGVIRYLSIDIVNKISKKNHFKILMIVTIVVNVYQSIIGKNILNTVYAEFFYDSIVTIIWLFLLFTYILRIELSDKMKKICKKMSSLTLGVYIIHPGVMEYMKGTIEPDTFHLSIIFFGVVTIISFVIVYEICKVSLIKKLLFTI